MGKLDLEYLAKVLLKSNNEVNKMTNTETSFGLQNINGKISADGGRTFLPKYSEMADEMFQNLILDVEFFLERPIDERDVNDLIEILS